VHGLYERLPPPVTEPRGRRRTTRCSHPARRHRVDDHEVLRVQLGQEPTDAVRCREDAVAGVAVLEILVEERPRDLEVTALQLRPKDVGLLREEADRAELEPAVAGLADLVEHPAPRGVRRRSGDEDGP
jgi:hypothetical protein